MFDLARYLTGWQTIGVLLTFAGVWGFFYAPGSLAIAIVAGGFLAATSDGKYFSETKSRSEFEKAMAKPWPISWRGYVAFLISTALALAVRASFDRVGFKAIAIVGSVILLSSGALILLRLAFTRADARKKTG